MRQPGEATPDPRLALLDVIEIFRPFSAQERVALAEAMRERTLPAGTVVMRQGEAGDSHDATEPSRTT